jgi:hypothetical protein
MARPAPSEFDRVIRRQTGAQTPQEKIDDAVAEVEARRDAVLAEAQDSVRDPRDLAAEALAHAGAARNEAELRARITAEAGLPAELADRLRGDDAGALAADAKALAAVISETAAQPATGGMDALIRGRIEERK